MAELQTLARPYAEAAFELAQESRDQSGWADALARLSAVAQAAQGLDLIGHPRLGDAELVAALAEVAGSLNVAQRQFLQLLVRNERLAVLPQIAVHYQALCRSEAGALEAHITSAFPLTPAQLNELVVMLSAKHGRPVEAKLTTDPDLIGGVSIRIGDEVWDASVRGKLAQLADVLMN
jgi:F-type H+-transporting ATPase subunit delta